MKTLLELKVFETYIRYTCNGNLPLSKGLSMFRAKLRKIIYTLAILLSYKIELRGAIMITHDLHSKVREELPLITICQMK